MAKKPKIPIPSTFEPSAPANIPIAPKPVVTSVDKVIGKSGEAKFGGVTIRLFKTVSVYD